MAAFNIFVFREADGTKLIFSRKLVRSFFYLIDCERNVFCRRNLIIICDSLIMQRLVSSELCVLRKIFGRFLIQPLLHRHSVGNMEINFYSANALDFVQVDIAPLAHLIVAVQNLIAVSLPVFADFGDERFTSAWMKVAQDNRMLLRSVRSADFRCGLNSPCDVFQRFLEEFALLALREP